MKWLFIDGRQSCKGIVDLKKESFFGLEVGSNVTQIGDGRETGSFRTDRFVKPFVYSGSFIHEAIEYFVFRIPFEMLPLDSEPHYILYESTGGEVLSRHKEYNRFFVAKFEIVN